VHSRNVCLQGSRRSPIAAPMRPSTSVSKERVFCKRATTHSASSRTTCSLYRAGTRCGYARTRTLSCSAFPTAQHSRRSVFGGRRRSPDQVPMQQEEIMNDVVAATRPLTWEMDGPSRIPFAAYTREDLYRRELERFFYSKHWCYVGLEAEVPN